MLYDLRGIGSRGLLPVKIGPVITKEIAVITSIIVIAKIVIVGIIKVIIVAVFIAEKKMIPMRNSATLASSMPRAKRASWGLLLTPHAHTIINISPMTGTIASRISPI